MNKNEKLYYMNVYLSVIVCLVVLLIIELNNPQKNRSHLFFFGSSLIFSIIAFRGSDVGGDTLEYVKFFKGEGSMYGSIDDSEMEIGFVLIARFLHFFNESTLWFLFSSTLITLLPFFYIVKKYSSNQIIPLLLFMTTWSILSTSLCAIRQNFAVSLAMIAYLLFSYIRDTSISNKISATKRTLFVISIVSLCFLSILTHTSMIVVLPLMILSEFVSLNRKSMYIIVLGSFVGALILNNLFGTLFEQFNIITQSLEYAERMNSYYGNVKYELTNEVSFNRLGPTTLYVLISIYKSNEEELNSYFLKCLVIGHSLFCIGASFPMMSRAVYPLLLFGISFVPFSMNLSKNIKSKFLLILLLLFFVRTQFKYYAEYNISENYYGVRLLPYKSIFEEL